MTDKFAADSDRYYPCTKAPPGTSLHEWSQIRNYDGVLVTTVCRNCGKDQIELLAPPPSQSERGRLL